MIKATEAKELALNNHEAILDKYIQDVSRLVEHNAGLGLYVAEIPVIPMALSRELVLNIFRVEGYQVQHNEYTRQYRLTWGHA